MPCPSPERDVRAHQPGTARRAPTLGRSVEMARASAPDLFEDAQVVFAEDFADDLVGVAAFDQTTGDVWQFVHAGEAGGGAFEAEEVGAEADVVGAEFADDRFD